MLGNDRMETASNEVTSIWRRNDIEKSTWITHLYFVDFRSWIPVETSTSNRCYNFHVDLAFKIDVTLTNFLRAILTLNPWRIDGDESIGLKPLLPIMFNLLMKSQKFSKWHYVSYQSNLADYTSRALDERNSENIHRWFCGPSFFWSKDRDWLNSDKINSVSKKVCKKKRGIILLLLMTPSFQGLVC